MKRGYAWPSRMLCEDDGEHGRCWKDPVHADVS